MSVPTRHRDVLMDTTAGQLTITRHHDGCLLVYPRPEWERVRAELVKLPASAQWLKRIYLGSAMDVEMDGTGRVLISPELRAAGKLVKEVVLLGLGHCFELWDKVYYEAKEAEARQAGMSNALDVVSL